jgi:hypothetical protein
MSDSSEFWDRVGTQHSECRYRRCGRPTIFDGGCARIVTDGDERPTILCQTCNQKMVMCNCDDPDGGFGCVCVDGIPECTVQTQRDPPSGHLEGLA